MGHKELIESLYREADKKVTLLLKTAEAEAESIRSETAERIKRLRDDFSSREAAAAARDTAALTGKAEREARAIVLSSEKELSERLRRLASSCLNELRSSEYDAVFSALCRELPSAEWKTVRVNPADIDIAKRSLPEADIITDQNITGGMTVLLGNGEVQVSNTFEKRLEKAWEEIAPLIIKDIYTNIK